MVIFFAVEKNLEIADDATEEEINEKLKEIAGNDDFVWDYKSGVLTPD